MIRFAEASDIPRLLEMGAAMHAESQWIDMPFSTSKVTALFEFLMQSEDALLVVAERDGDVVGMMGATVQEHWMSEARVACDLFLFVEPEQRGGMAAVRMVNTYTGWALNRNATKIMLGAMTGVNPEKAARLFHRAGYEQMGTMHQFVRAA